MFMGATIEKILLEVQELSNTSKAILADKIIELIDKDKIDEIEKMQILEVKRRISEVNSGSVQLIDGETALRRARSVLNEI